MVALGVIYPPDQPAPRLMAAAQRAEAAGLDELWLWEDCFVDGGVAMAALALAATTQLRIGLGLMPVPLRNVGLTAMEVATLAAVFPDRFLPGVGHGVLEWMEQAGVGARSPLGLLREYTTALRQLLHGDTVTCSGDYVTLDRVALRRPPSVPPPLFVGAIKPRTLALAGELADGVIFTGGTSPDQVRAALETVREARQRAGRVGEVDAVVFLSTPTPSDIHRIADDVAELAEAGATRVAVTVLSAQGGPPLATADLLDEIDRLGQVSVPRPGPRRPGPSR